MKVDKVKFVGRWPKSWESRSALNLGAPVLDFDTWAMRESLYRDGGWLMRSVSQA